MFVSRTATNAEPPDRIVSPDGRLQALVRNIPCTSEIASACTPLVSSACPGGVLLRSDFGSDASVDYLSGPRVNLSPSAKLNSLTNMTGGGSAARELSTTWYHDGADHTSIKVTDTVASLAAAVYVMTANAPTDARYVPVVPGGWYQASVWVYQETASTGTGANMTINYGHRGGAIDYSWARTNYASKVAGSTSRLTVEFQVPADWDPAQDQLGARILVGSGAVGEYIYVDDMLWEQVTGPGQPFRPYFDDQTPDTAHRRYELLSDGTFLAASVNPLIKVRFTRSDGTLVRSGNDAWAPDGVAYAYDDEMPFGQAVSWTATPVFADGSLGTPSQAVSYALPDPEGCYDSWIKSIDSPQFDQQVFITADAVPEFTYAAKNAIDYPQGSKYPVGSTDVHNAATTTLTAYTATDEEEDKMHALLESGHLLFQTATKYHIPDFYFIVGDIGMTVVWVSEKSLWARKWTIPVTTIARPDPYGAPLIIAGESYADMIDQTYAQLAAAWPSYRALTEAGRAVA